MIRGIFFDLDDTLIGYSEAEHTAFAVGCRAAAARYPRLDPDALAAAIYDAYETRFGYGTDGFALLATLPVAEMRRRLTEDGLAAFGVRDPDLVETLLTVYAEAERHHLRAFPDVRETLARLRPYFYLGVITNGPSAFQREKLAAVALDGAFDAIVVDTEFGHPKPDPRIFRHAAAQAGRPPDELLFVGNSLGHDVAGARAAGWTSVWMNPDGTPRAAADPRPDYTIRGIGEVTALPPVRAAMASPVREEKV